MPTVTLKHSHERFDSLLRRWKKSVEKTGTLNDARKHEFYEKPTSIRKRRKAAAVKRQQRELAEDRASGKGR